MSDINKLKNYANKICNNDNVLNIYYDLLEIFNENGLFQETVGTLESIYNITKEPELYKQIGNIFLTQLRIPENAKIAYERYLYLSQPEFFDYYRKTTDISSAAIENNGTDSELINVVDRYSEIVYILVYFLNRKMYNEMLEIASYLDCLQCKINELNSFDHLPMEHYSNAKEHLSYLLSQVKHHNDINRLAIRLNSKNEKAYINIIHDLIEYNNFNEALEFYNNIYIKEFPNIDVVLSIIDLCWQLSDKYGSFGDYYSSILCQQKAINIELLEKL